MSFQVSEELDQLLTNIKLFLVQEVYPKEKEVIEKGFNSALPILEELRNMVKKKGWWAPAMPKEYGGMGLSFLEFARISEILGTTPIGHYIFNSQAPDIGNMELMLEFGTKDQKEKYLRRLVNGEIRSCFSMVEPDRPGSNPTWIETTAQRDRDNYIINGHKWFTSSADGATFNIVMAVTNPNGEKHKKASMLIVDMDNPGFEFIKNIPVMGEEGEGWMSHAEVKYNDCQIPITNLLGAEGEGFALAQHRLGPGRIHHCMRWIGICERAFDLMCKRAVSRRITPEANLASQQTVMNWIAECRADINAARLMVLDTANKIDTHGQYKARDDISIIKFFVANILLKVLDRAIQVHGALGVTDYTPLSYWYRHERPSRIYDGPDEVHKRAVSRRILSKYNDN
ncbi:MAG: acyl-CoA dehydrogenase family protein [Candidatus Heimdallarchaeota archaeon]|nr:acyl-CoA dehydrogenase family protein [Candidatus Heimdallarchaeota archaeon]MDH5644588.1 acyl-CoA dehydrogenase family protein [Candidatus Heimdallarchaeota archaeon]